MIRTLIIEDEEPAAKRLARLLNQIDAAVEVVDILDGVAAAVKWFRENEAPDLLMLDIQLSDGISFDIFKQVQVNSFVIFTTAYDEYAIKAFELNSIDYLLKPIDTRKLTAAFEKFKRLQKQVPSSQMNDLLAMVGTNTKNYKKRFVINAGSRLISVEAERVQCFYSSNKDTYLINNNGKTYPVDFSLDKLEELLDPDLFFRISRKEIINFRAIRQIHILSKSRIKLETEFKTETDLLVSSTKSRAFREWLDR